MDLRLTANEARVIGCLVEKSIVTPDQYPLTLNALTNACNQKSSREPVMKLPQGEVQRTIRSLENQSLVRTDENFKSRVEKYTHRFCNTRYSEFQFDSAQLAIICLLMLRGAQTPGEIKSRSGRLHNFADNTEVVTALATLAEWEGSPLVMKLPRTSGRKDSEYMHLFFGPIDVDAYETESATQTVNRPSSRVDTSELRQRVEKLEADVAELKALLSVEDQSHGSGPVSTG